MGQQLTANRSQQVEQVTVASGMCFLYAKPVCLFFLFPGTWRSLLWISVHEALSESQKGLLTPLTSLNTLTSAHKICQRSPFFLLHIVYLLFYNIKLNLRLHTCDPRVYSPSLRGAWRAEASLMA